MQKLVIVTANHGREGILSLFCAGINRLQEQATFPIHAIVVGDKNDICHKYGVEHVIAPNHPITSKFNLACLTALKHAPTHVLIMGSDNICNIEMINYMMSCTENDFVNIQDVYFYSVSKPHMNQIIYICTSTVGAGRLIRADLMDKLDWKPWRLDRDKGMDQVIWRELVKHWKSPHLFVGKPIGATLIDIKSDESLNGFDKWNKSTKLNPRDILTFLSDKERDILNKLLSL